MSDFSWVKRQQQVLSSSEPVAVPEGNHAVFPPLVDSVKFSFKRTAEAEKLFRGERDGFMYSRVGNPNSKQLEDLLSALIGGQGTVLTPNGISAIGLVLHASLKPGDRLLAFEELYAPSKRLIWDYILPKGVEVRWVNADRLDQAVAVVRDFKPTICLFESPTNPQLKIVDINRLVESVHAVGGKLVMDNTFASFHQQNDLGVDVIVHSLTKFACGYGDAFGGSATFFDQGLFQENSKYARSHGLCLEPAVARSFVKSLKSYPLRYQRAAQSAHYLAAKMEEAGLFQFVHYPFMPSHPQYQLAQLQMKDGGSVISARLLDGQVLYDFIDRLELFELSPSLGSVDSLIAPTELFYGSGFTSQEKRRVGIDSQTFRLSVGLQDPDDLMADLKRALQA